MSDFDFYHIFNILMQAVVNDTQLILKLQNGDKQALFGLYDKYSGALYGVVLRICNREDLAHDVLQETFLKIWKKIGQYDPQKGKFYTWAYRIAKNSALNAVRNPSPLIQMEDLSVYDNRSEEQPRDFSELNGLLKNLEPQHQKAIELVYFKGLTHQEAHKEMDVPLGTFKSYVRQAVVQLRENYPKDLLLIMSFVALIGHG